jgi:putative CocE/NonD family hydrolase
MLHVGGWFDPYLRGDVRLYREMAARSQYPQPFWVGPWGHIPWGRKLGDRDFGPQASSPIDRLQVRWFDHWLKGRDTGLMAAAPLQWFDLGQHQWRELPHWPEGQTQVWQLGSRGLPSLCPQDGYLELLPEAPASAAEAEAGAGTEVVVDTWVHDPWRPVPSLGGHSAIPSGPFERSHLDDRSDVLTYTSEPLTTALTDRWGGDRHLDLPGGCPQL